MGHEYKTLAGWNRKILDDQVNKHLAKGWDLWGNQYAFLFRFFQVMVHFDPARNSIVKNAAEVMGYTVGVPETPAVEDFHKLGQAIGTGMRREKKHPEHIVEVPVLAEFDPPTVVESTVPLFRNMLLCSCGGRPGDNPDCPVPHGKISRIY